MIFDTTEENSQENSGEYLNETRLEAIMNVPLERLAGYQFARLDAWDKYFYNETRAITLDDPQVKADAKNAQDVVRLLKKRLNDENMLRWILCPYCPSPDGPNRTP